MLYNSVNILSQILKLKLNRSSRWWSPSSAVTNLGEQHNACMGEIEEMMCVVYVTVRKVA